MNSKKETDRLKRRIESLKKKNELLKSTADKKLKNLRYDLECLEQDQVYILRVDEENDIKMFREVINYLNKQIPWSLPPILVMNKDLLRVQKKDLSLVKKLLRCKN